MDEVTIIEDEVAYSEQEIYGLAYWLGPVFKLATELFLLGEDAFVYSEILELPLPRRPIKLMPILWEWPDCHRSIHYYLAKKEVTPSVTFCGVLLRLAEGDYSCLPIAADVLEEDGCVLTELLTLMRKPR
jgi:hypothetical protein